MIEKLNEEAEEYVTEKACCDEELAMAEAQKAAHEEELDEFKTVCQQSKMPFCAQHNECHFIVVRLFGCCNCLYMN